MILLTISNTELIILIVIGLLLLIVIGASIINYMRIKKEQLINKTELQLEEDLNIINNILPDAKEEHLTFPEITEEDAEAERIDIEEIVEEEEEELSEIEKVLRQMQDNLDNHDPNKVRTFEEEQEEKAVISYQELKTIKETDSLELEVNRYEDEQENVPTKISEIESLKKMDKEEITTIAEETDIIKEHEDRLKSANSKHEFISPIYGKMEVPEANYPKVPNFKDEYKYKHDKEKISFDNMEVSLKKAEDISLEDALNIDPISEETKNNKEFLEALKDFRNNLE